MDAIALGEPNWPSDALKAANAFNNQFQLPVLYMLLVGFAFFVGMPVLNARDKRTGKIIATIELPMPGQYGMMTYMHEGKQYILVQSGSARRNQPGSLVALALP